MYLFNSDTTGVSILCEIRKKMYVTYVKVNKFVTHYEK